jgi:hypothetical protein
VPHTLVVQVAHHKVLPVHIPQQRLVPEDPVAQEVQVPADLVASIHIMEVVLVSMEKPILIH